jgi:hypothetical protein
MVFYLVLGFSNSSEAKTIGFRWMFDSPGFSNLASLREKCFSCVSISSAAKHRWNSAHVRFAWAFKTCFMKNVFETCVFVYPVLVSSIGSEENTVFIYCVLLIRQGFQHLLHDNFVLKSACALVCHFFI